MCQECYIDDSRVTPLIKPNDCLINHTQYICGTCGRCICIEQDQIRKVQRWNFPFKSLEIAKMYLRTADYTMKKACTIYKIENTKGRIFYKIFADSKDVERYLKKNNDKILVPMFSVGKYKEYPNTQIRKLTNDEVMKYMLEHDKK